MNAVFDTNVFVSALLFGGRPRLALEKVIEGAVRLHISPDLIGELRTTLSRQKFKLSPEQTAFFIEEIEALCTPVLPREKIKKACRDQKDHIVLECAVASACDALVTGDEDLLVLKTYRGVPIISVAGFLDRF
ncbi:MAG: putative toxin-antitoxin system toxin component, PIN family [Candidatus Raymondbacteria bacterium RifOxyC12_full_50_8]|uniref:Putative toxin-antitoxin system toxin component, PIN family n=1 Tax=Candidatus Raymondbacteria bacterium RIFOXYD12_FULL_49_13 TaxID=1817890 RepID=A0A1F7FHS2_UNCRA|nr:MAG: putative toxin-antitoxin system toxin component, PIN family [Candidatus Raymondbacteria bacterium RIFOXYA2_FULL_49_16]OGJ99530.1 MAG: putative toxin-antitoxin system toxin component, PIN family [Candidatus Raymondbacteria bacterium RifOxyB12_full_50_8]OGK06259.1 MAG: putative toxin-antitoxin system toxin component, PIN family [Candidatus Raymondbacteria bacterium RIFOXYD12_FULL_49_13]OGK07715.1 MAG: putative toxin-antitoxin system toxin component, PIN family [Candidatus Raymondbacteria b